MSDIVSSAFASRVLSGRRILFFVPESSLQANSVYASQVGGLADYVRSLGAEVMVWDGVLKGHCWFFQVSSRLRQLARQNKELKDFRPTHIYVRTFQSCLAARELADETGAKLVYSMRGADVAEILMKGDFRSLVLALFAAVSVRRAVRCADHVNSVSRAMADWIRRKWHREASVLPCCAADSAFAERRPRQANSAKTIVYNGGIYYWQKIDAILALLKKMSDIDSSLRFRLLTREQNVMAAKCSAIGFDASRWTAKCCEPGEVPAELAQADCGIILRDDTLVNRVASPIKIGEYLAAGLGVLVSPCIGDVSHELAEQEFAKFVTNETSTEELVSFVRRLTEEAHASAQAWAREHFTYEGNRSAVLQMFA